MNAEELKTEFGLEFPTEIDGYKRPAEPLESGHDWFTEIPQLIAKDKVLYTGMNLILSALLSNEKLLKQWHDTLQNVVNAQDWRVVTDSLKGYMTPELKKKLDGIAIGANNYVHPSNHPATMITQDATHRFVSDTEKNTWNAKASTAVVSTTANGLAPKRDGNASHFLAGDGTWKAVPSASSAASATKATQDSRGQQIDTTYVKDITASDATLTVTKGNGTTSTVTVNVAHSTKATQDSQGQTINTTYVKGVTASNSTITVTKGNGTTSTAIINNVAHSTSADSATKANQDSQGQTINTTYVKGITASDATLTVTKGNGSTSSVTVNNVANATNANIVTEKAITGNTLASALPVGMTWSKVYNNGFPCAYGNCLSIRGAGAIQIVTECSSGDATPANMYYRNARDSSIDKWNAWRTLAHTGGTISNATIASKLGTGTVGSGVKPIYLNAGSPVASGSTVGNANRPIYMNGGTLSQCSIDLSTLAPKASPALTGTPTAPTPSTSDNSTRVATTAFVKSLFTANTDYTGWYKDAVTGIVRQWGFVTYNSSPNPQVITPPITFSTLLSCGATDTGREIGTGNTFANMDFTGGKLYIRPVYGDNQPGDNGVVLRWWVDCLL